MEVPLPEGIEVDTGQYFQTSMTFDSQEDVIKWARSTGTSHGVVVVVSRSDLNDPNRTPRIMLGCERGGEYRGGNQVKKRRTSTKKCGCPFKLKAQLLDASVGTWGLFVINGLHNHSLAKVFEGHSFVGRLSSEEKNIVERLSKTGVKSREILSQLKLNDPTNVSTMKTVYNARTIMKVRESSGRTHMQQLFKKLGEYGYVSRHRSEPMTDVIQDLFWSSSDSIKLAKAFPFVIILDCTYKTNKYRLPLLQIVGVTSTDKTFVIALCYMSGEKEDNFCWALNCFRDIFDDVQMPSVFVTDRDLALINAIKSVFPDSKNLLCRVHVERNILSNCISLFPTRDIFDDFMKSFAAVMHSCTIDEYQKNVHILETTFHEYPKAVNYVIESWLGKYKECFVSAWIDKYFHVGNTSTNRVEGSHSKLKKYLTNSLSGFVESFDKFHLLVEGQILDIKASFEESLTRVPLRFRKPLYKHLTGVVSITAMDKIEFELSSIGSHVGVATNCSHNAITSVGLPCAHLLARYRDTGSPIPLNDVHKFWRKLDMTPFRADNEDNEKEVSICVELDIISNKFAVATLPQKLEIKRQLQVIGNATFTTLLEPKAKVNLRGRKKGTKGSKKNVPVESSTKRDPSAFEYAEKHVFEDVLQSQKSVSSVKPPKKPSKLKVHRTRNPQLCNYVEMFPDEWQQFITNVIDVPGDGHCGFRVVASFLGMPRDGWKQVRLSLAAELIVHNDEWDIMLKPVMSSTELLHSVQCEDETVGCDKWLVMPYMGNVISTCYNVVVVLISSNLCLTFFPLRRKAPVSPPQGILVFGYINDNHFVRLELSPDSPLPSVSKTWRDFHQQAAGSWPSLYASRIEHFQKIMSLRQSSFASVELIE